MANSFITLKLTDDYILTLSQWDRGSHSTSLRGCVVAEFAKVEGSIVFPLSSEEDVDAIKLAKLIDTFLQDIEQQEGALT